MDYITRTVLENIYCSNYLNDQSRGHNLETFGKKQQTSFCSMPNKTLQLSFKTKSIQVALHLEILESRIQLSQAFPPAKTTHWEIKMVVMRSELLKQCNVSYLATCLIQKEGQDKEIL